MGRKCLVLVLLLLRWMLPRWKEVLVLAEGGGPVVREYLCVGLGKDRDGRRRCAGATLSKIDVGGVAWLDSGLGRVVAEAATVGMGDFGRYRHRDDSDGDGGNVFQGRIGRMRMRQRREVR